MSAEESAELRDALKAVNDARGAGGGRRGESALATATVINSDTGVVAAAVRLLGTPDDDGATRLEVRDQSMTHRRWFKISDDGAVQWGDR